MRQDSMKRISGRGRRNPLVDDPLDSYARTYESYSEWRVKWWRELVQNSLDARATKIKLGGEQLPDGSWSFYCADNGVGMDRETLVTKFFTIGGTGKRGSLEEMIGGFGEAKKLIAFAWPRWTIHSGSTLARGQYRYYELEDAPAIQGTVVTVEMPGDLHTTIDAAMELLQRSSTRGVRILINGELFSDRLLASKEVGEVQLEWIDRETKLTKSGVGTIHHNKSAQYGAVYVRANGLYMFTRTYLGDSKLGTVVLEIPGAAARGVFQNNRDGFRDDTKIGQQLDALVRRIAIEGTSALKKTKSFTKTWEGARFDSTFGGDSAVLGAMIPKPTPPPGKKLTITADEAMEIIESLKNVQEEARWRLRTEGGVEEGSVVIEGATPEMVKAIAEAGIPGAPTQAALAQQLVWRPAFMLRNEKDDYTVPPKFYPERMEPKVEALLQVWAKACMWVFIQLGASSRYGVGFVFADDVGAMYVRHAGRDWLLINPLSDGMESTRVFSKSSREDMKWLYAAAIHEATHMAGGHYDHDKAFAYALTRNFGTCSDGFSTMLKLAREVKLRREEKPDKPPRVAGVTKKFVKSMIRVLVTIERYDYLGVPTQLRLEAREGPEKDFGAEVSSPEAVEMILSMIRDAGIVEPTYARPVEIALPGGTFSALYELSVNTRGMLDSTDYVLPIYVERMDDALMEVRLYPTTVAEIYDVLVGLQAAAVVAERGGRSLSVVPVPLSLTVRQWTTNWGDMIETLGLSLGIGEAATGSIPMSLFSKIADDSRFSW